MLISDGPVSLPRARARSLEGVIYDSPANFRSNPKWLRMYITVRMLKESRTEWSLTVGVHLLSFFSVSVFIFGDRFPFEWVSIVNSLAKYEPRVVMSILFLHGLWWGGEKKRQRSFLLTLTRTFLLSWFSLMVAALLGSSLLSFLNSLYLFFFPLPI